MLAWLSFIAVPFMFGGGIVTAFSMRATGALDTYVNITGAVWDYRQYLQVDKEIVRFEAKDSARKLAKKLIPD